MDCRPPARVPPGRAGGKVKTTVPRVAWLLKMVRAAVSNKKERVTVKAVETRVEARSKIVRSEEEV
jgi:murein L,D-transpeptidase YafK